ncbi:MOSC domain-containing protein [Ketobacter sp. MCCC 1A13808]|uniref:MOSC domain-containing protein n=1 Tax=Ketobacter sp. MCCC 1A13808 TaxID=2602738 RepID=UPI0012EC2F98|nr:MOSC domain-containing protein [Ketobacter sp. MCCC 1A13808]MVF12706.1 MOSC domain-containing protein [Ketobacter sp. MCCC 1A13808]
MRVTQLFIHPVKSLGGISVQSYAVDRFGPQWDRRWMVVDEQGRFITQRQYAKMALIRTSMDQDQVTLTVPDGSELQFSSREFNYETPVTVSVWRDQCVALEGRAELSEWLSNQLGIPCRLVFMPEQSRRLVDTAYAENRETVSFADGFPLLLTTEESLQDLNLRLGYTVGMNRFRPNLVLDGEQPWQEDTWQRLIVGEAEFVVAKPCSRCAIPTIDPETGSKQPEVFRTLKQFRQQDGQVFFGQNLLVSKPGVVRVGDIARALPLR